MANIVANVMPGRPLATGGAYNAPLGTALPADEKTALNAAFQALGYVSEDGIKIKRNRSTDSTKAWGGDIILTTQSEYGEEITLTLVESLRGQVLKTVFGSANVTVTPATSSAGTKTAVATSSDLLEHYSWVFEMAAGVKRRRVVIPDGQVTEVSEVGYTDSDAIAYEIKIQAYADASGKVSYEYTDDGVKAA